MEFEGEQGTSATIAKIFQRPRRRARPSIEINFYDNTAENYGWLLPGWVAEERHMKSGRIYRVIKPHKSQFLNFI